jgi:hypothetical protein
MVWQLGRWSVCLLLIACSGTSKIVHEQAAAPRARTIHPAAGSEECVEMYGSCTPPPDPLCTSNAFVLACGESGELPSSGERLTCACP